MKGYSDMTWKFLSVALLLLAGVLFLAAYEDPKYGRSAISGDYIDVGLQTEKPKIDNAVPARVETATFALG